MCIQLYRAQRALIGRMCVHANGVYNEIKQEVAVKPEGDWERLRLSKEFPVRSVGQLPSLLFGIGLIPFAVISIWSWPIIVTDTCNRPLQIVGAV